MVPLMAAVRLFRRNIHGYNNDTEAEPDFLEEMVAALRRHKKAFSCQAKMIQLHDRDKMDDAGNYYCALGWAFARGKGKDISHYDREQKIFSTCAGAAIYRKKFIDRIGDFDEEHFAYLEDLDIGYRARICGYQNWYAPKAKVYGGIRGEDPVFCVQGIRT